MGCALATSRYVAKKHLLIYTIIKTIFFLKYFKVKNIMTIPILLRKPSAFLPVAMSLAAFSVIFIHIILHGTTRQADEGAAAHLWQLLMSLQIPIIAFFGIRWLKHSPKYTLLVLVLQLVAALIALAPVYLLHW